MHIITRTRLNEFVSKHPNAEPGLAHWYHTLKPATIRSFVELRALFPSADQVGKLTVFNISGNTVLPHSAIWGSSGSASPKSPQLRGSLGFGRKIGTATSFLEA